MDQSYTPPSTIAGISRLAKTICRDRGIKHTLALDQAAQIAGFQNHKHAKRQLALVTPPEPLQSLYLTVYWHDREAQPFSGRCTVEVQLPQSTLNFLPSLKARGYWLLGGFELESADHLRARSNATSQERAQKRIMDAVRELQFCAVTGLRPMRKIADKERVSFLQELPGQDHLSLWVEADSGNWLALDEPYPSRFDMNQAKREEWIAAQGLKTTKPDWEGLYLPGRSIPILVTADADLQNKVASIVKQLPPLPSVDWSSLSGSYYSQFLSPMRVASGKRYRARPDASYGLRAGAIAYGGRPGFASDWRPEKSMTVKQHQKLGEILKGLAWSELSMPAHNKLSIWISTLDDWSAIEHSGESSRTLTNLYYGDRRATYPTLRGQLRGLSKARSLILFGYNECRPRHALLKALDAVEQSAIKRAKRGSGKS
ncbi:DUF5623 domain-containing protein [Pseudomonas cichorii]|nr:DUF5623 domain-containing protein [Pseudomonas cichorii]